MSYDRTVEMTLGVSAGLDGLSKNHLVRPPVLIIGLGNPILGDDGVGWQVATQVAHHLQLDEPGREDQYSMTTYKSADVEIDCLAVGGLALMERLVGYDRVIIIDAITTGKHPQGTTYSFRLEELPEHTSAHLASTHDTTLQNAIKMGQTMGARLPNRIDIVGVEAVEVYDFSEQLSPSISQAVPAAVKLVMELLK